MPPSSQARPAGPSSVPEPHPAIRPVPAFSDNYIWLLISTDTRRAAVVDPGDAGPVLAALSARGLALAAVLITHHHPDHVGGLPELARAFPDAVVHGPCNPAIAGIDRRYRAGDTLELEGFDPSFRKRKDARTRRSRVDVSQRSQQDRVRGSTDCKGDEAALAFRRQLFLQDVQHHGRLPGRRARSTRAPGERPA
jgi:hypothetical protein